MHGCYPVFIPFSCHAISSCCILSNPIQMKHTFTISLPSFPPSPPFPFPFPSSPSTHPLLSSHSPSPSSSPAHPHSQLSQLRSKPSLCSGLSISPDPLIDCSGEHVSVWSEVSSTMCSSCRRARPDTSLASAALLPGQIPIVTALLLYIFQRYLLLSLSPFSVPKLVFLQLPYGLLEWLLAQ